MNVPGRSALRLVLAGIVLSVMPAASLIRQNLSAKPSTQISLPANLSIFGENIIASTELNTLDLSQLAGATDMAVGDVIYVHLNIKVDHSSAAPKQINYPFAISQNRPLRMDTDTISLRGVVTSRRNNKINVQYLFENLAPQKQLRKALSNDADGQGEILLDINSRAVGHVKAISLDGKEIEYR